MFYCGPPSKKSAVIAACAFSALHAHDLAQRVDDLDEVGLRRHDGIDVLVRRRRLVDHVCVLAALHARVACARGRRG